MDKMRIALCLSGQMRTFSLCLHSFIEYIIEPLKPDIFIHTLPDNNLGLLSFLGAKIIKAEIDYPMDEKNYLQKIRTTTKSYPIQQCLQQWNSLYQVNELKKIYENKHEFIYDIVIRSRMDLLFHSPIIIEKGMSDKDIVYVPDFGYNRGINDRFAIGTSNSMDKCVNIINNLEKILLTVPFHGESVFEANLRIEKIIPKFFDIKFDRLRKDKYRKETWKIY